MDIRTIGVEDYLNVWEMSATYDIAQSTISSLTMGEILQLDGADGSSFYDRLNAQKMNYGWIEGSPEFKAEVARLYRTDIDPDRILQTNGCTGANLNALMVLVEPGDHVIAEYPTYQPLYDIPRMLGAEVEYWHIRREAGWQPDIEELKRLVRPDTKLICLNNASNPLGTVLSADMLNEVVEIARSVDAYILCDEVYLPLEDTDAFVSVADLYDKGVVTNSISKTYSVPAARIGWTVSNKEVADRIRVYRDYTMICGGVFNDCLASYVLANREAVLERNRSIILRNRAIVQEWVDAEPRASWTPPKGVSVSYLSLDIPMEDEPFCLDLLKNEGVLLVPGSRFDLPDGVRLGYCAAEDTLREGLKRLGKELRSFD